MPLGWGVQEEAWGVGRAGCSRASSARASQPSTLNSKSVRRCGAAPAPRPRQVSYVEYQKNHRLVVHAHKAALIATRTFWQVLMHTNVPFTALANALNEIERTVQKTEEAYKVVLGRYSGNPKLTKTYARFLEDVVNDPWKASKHYALADQLTEQQEADEAAGAELAAGDSGRAEAGAEVGGAGPLALGAACTRAAA